MQELHSLLEAAYFPGGNQQVGDRLFRWGFAEMWASIPGRFSHVRRNGTHRLRGRIVPLFAALLTAAALTGCTWEPPRDNPVDPGSPGYRGTGLLTVRVAISTSPLIPLDSTVVQLLDDSLSAFGGADGTATLEVPHGLVRYEIRREGFNPHRDSARVEVGSHVVRPWVTLDGLPWLDSLCTMTGIEETGDGRKLYYYMVAARAGDRDGNGNLEGVEYYESPGGPRYSMTLNPETGCYERGFSFSFTGWDSLRARIGHEVFFVARDVTGDSVTASTLVRPAFEYDELADDIPNDQQISPEQPTFHWNPSNVLFSPLRYRFELFLAGNNTPEYSALVEGDHGTSFSVTVDDTLLPSVVYEWQLTLYDPFDSWVRTPKMEVSPDFRNR